MKRVLPLLLLVAAVVLGVIAVRAPEPRAAPPLPERSSAVPWRIHAPVPVGSEVRSFAVEGMCCEGCAGKLREALLAVDGVSDAAVDSVEGRAQAVVPQGFPEAALVSALSFEDYRAEPLD